MVVIVTFSKESGWAATRCSTSRPSSSATRPSNICGAELFWTAMAGRLLKEIEGDAGGQPCSVPHVVETLHRALADHARSHIIGDGVLVGTVHAAKGLEFPHVLVLGGDWRGQDRREGSSEAERRLYYVAMTRARETLTLLNRRDDPIPYLDEFRTPGLVRRTVAVAGDGSATHARHEYTILGMGELFLDLAGRKHAKHRIHRSLARIRAGDLLKLERGGDGRVRVLDRNSIEAARLSGSGARQWQRPQLSSVDEVRVLAVVSRREEDCKPGFRERVVVPSWEVPILEVRHRRMHPSARPVPESGPAVVEGDSRQVEVTSTGSPPGSGHQPQRPAMGTASMPSPKP